MVLFALDTCDSRGSVALLRGAEVLEVLVHDCAEEYSSWLPRAVERILNTAGQSMRSVEAYAVAAGPGSFTGLRVGLTTVKAWSEVFGRPIVAVSRLEALASQAEAGATLVAAFVDAHRGQVFGGLYTHEHGRWERVEDEMVVAPGKFVDWVAERSRAERVAWVSPDGEHITGQENWRAREAAGERVERVSAVFAPLIGKIGYRKLLENQTVDALTLDANYIRRSDAELFWKGGSGHDR